MQTQNKRYAANVESEFKKSAMLKLADHFHSLATGASQVPLQSLNSHLLSGAEDPLLINYHNELINNAGPLFLHFLASVPYVLEELSRIGVALKSFAAHKLVSGVKHLSFLEADAFDGSNGRALAAQAGGLFRTLTTSPNKANEFVFNEHADRSTSYFFPESIFHLSRESLLSHDYAAFRDGFDVAYEMAAFQFYSKDRVSQISHLKNLLKPSGLAFFLEKHNHPSASEYEKRENVKDWYFKARYFTKDEIEWKKAQMLEQMADGQVLFEEFESALLRNFKYFCLLWNSTNFYEVVASDDLENLKLFLSELGPIVQPEQFCFEHASLGQIYTSNPF